MRPALLARYLLPGALLVLNGCGLFADAPHYRGIAVSAHDLGELTPGISSQADAQALLGPPTFEEQFDNNNWVYVSQVTKMRIGNTEGVSQQHVVTLSFDASGKLQKITQKDLGNAVRVAMDPAKTPVPGGTASVIQQLIGGVGSYNPLGATSAGGLGSSAGAGGLGGGPGNIGGTNSSGF